MKGLLVLAGKAKKGAPSLDDGDDEEEAPESKPIGGGAKSAAASELADLLGVDDAKSLQRALDAYLSAAGCMPEEE